MIMAATYGRTGATSYQDPDIRRVIAGLDRYGAAMVPGAYKVSHYCEAHTTFTYVLARRSTTSRGSALFPDVGRHFATS